MLRLQVLLRVSRRKWRWRKQAIDQLLHAPEDVPLEALQLLTKCAGGPFMSTLPLPYNWLIWLIHAAMPVQPTTC